MERAMKAIVYHDYGSLGNLELQDIEKPAPKEDEVLVKVHALAGLWRSLTGEKKMAALMAKPPKSADLAFMRELLESGKVTPVIDRRYTLREVPEALRYLSEGHARGKVVITV